MGGRLEKVKKIHKDYDYIIFHGLFFHRRRLLRLGNNIVRKMVWSVWGGDLYRLGPVSTAGMSFFRKVERIINNRLFDLADYKIKQFNSIVIGFKFDEIEARKQFGDKIKVAFARLTLPLSLKELDDAIVENAKAENNPIRVMLGHHADKLNNHEHLLNKLKKFNDQDMVISLPFSYGNNDTDYENRIRDKATELFRDKNEFLTELMPLRDYYNYLANVDIAMFDFKRQAALGNIYMMLYLGKKVFFNPEGVIYKQFISEGVPVFRTDDIDNMTFDEFTSMDFDATIGKNYVKTILDPNNVIGLWKKLFDGLGKD
jgi:hypothetical protein